MLDLIHELVTYLKNPYLTRLPEKVEKPIVLLLKLTFICLIMGMGSGMLLGILIKLRVVPDPGPSMMDKNMMSPVLFFIMAVILAPLAEEFIFRAQLRRFTGNLLFISFICGTFLSAIAKTDWGYLISPVVFVISYIIYRYNLSKSVTLKFRFWERVFPWHFHLTAICFALVHLSNFEKGIGLLSFGIFYTLPQLVVGLILGYTRMNYGLKYSYALHALYNFLPVLFFLSRH